MNIDGVRSYAMKRVLFTVLVHSSSLYSYLVLDTTRLGTSTMAEVNMFTFCFLLRF
jgi:hypothetical protein